MTGTSCPTKGTMNATQTPSAAFLDCRNSELPADLALLPLFRGELLVSSSHAVFCRVAPGDLPHIRALAAGDLRSTDLPRHLFEALDAHGFFSSPRPPKDEPQTVQLQLTNGCNLDCSYCCTNSGAPRHHEISFETVREGLTTTRAKLGPGIRVALLGGEPLLIPWVLDAADFGTDLGLEITLFTNGVPMAQTNVARRCAESFSRGVQFRVSLAGPTRELCDHKSGHDRFDDVIAGVNAFYRFGGEAILDLMLFPDHVEEVARHLPHLRTLLPEGIPIAFGIAYVSGREVGADLFASHPTMEAALDRIAFEAGETIPAVPPSPLAHRREGCSCAMGKHLHVRSDGALFPCFKMEEKIGHLDEEGFAASLDHVREHTHPAVALEKCRDCVLNTLCGAGCRSDNYLYTGDPEVPLCDTWRIRVLSELLAEDRVGALQWPVHHLLAEARRRDIPCPEQLTPVISSRHLRDT